jgi:DNA-directed RNA polymerase specialized sigma24 family protein
VTFTRSQANSLPPGTVTADDIREAEARYQQALAESKRLRELRDETVYRALASGVSHGEASDALGKSRGRAHQVAQRAPSAQRGTAR